MPDEAVLSVEALTVGFAGAPAPVIDGVGFSIAPGRTLCLVGESGCGKSVTALAVMGLLPPRTARARAGSVRFRGRDLAGLRPQAMADIRGGPMAMIFQEPMTSLNPVFTVGEQVAESIRRHQGLSPSDARDRALEMFRKVRIPAPEARFADYPHRLSGGMRQRVMIAMALANDPALLIADEPTTALDVTIQAQILTLIRDLQRDTGTALMLITHDLGVVAEMADEVAVMYAGRIVEQGPVAAVFRDPQHPYTIGLMGSMPRMGPRQGRLMTIPGVVPSAAEMPAGCRFVTRCPFAIPDCSRMPPPLTGTGAHRVACLRAPLEALA